MKLTWNLKKHLLPVCLVLAFALLLGLTLNLYKPLKRLTQKKVPNPKNVLQSADIKWCENISMNGVTFHRNEDGSIHMFGTSTSAFSMSFMLEPIRLEKGKTYILSSGMKHEGLRSYNIQLRDENKIRYAGTLKPETDNTSFKDYRFGSFTCTDATMNYQLWVTVTYTGAVIDETIYPVLVEGTEPGDFYTYK